MKTLKCLIISAFTLFCLTGFAQDQASLDKFNKVRVSPCVNLVLVKGETESIRIAYNDIPKENVHVKVHNGKLKIFLSHAKITEKQVRYTYNDHSGSHGIYNGSAITVYVTYRNLKAIDVRGEETLTCDDMLEADKFKLHAYGETKISLASLKAKKLKTVLYGENKLLIKSGNSDRQVYRLFGENKIDTEGMTSQIASTRVYGEGSIFVTASDVVRINALGEPRIHVAGTSFISKRVVLGKPNISVN